MIKVKIIEPLLIILTSIILTYSYGMKDRKMALSIMPGS
jgi:hypothetical protein